MRRTSGKRPRKSLRAGQGARECDAYLRYWARSPKLPTPRTCLFDVAGLPSEAATTLRQTGASKNHRRTRRSQSARRKGAAAVARRRAPRSPTAFDSASARVGSSGLIGARVDRLAFLRPQGARTGSPGLPRAGTQVTVRVEQVSDPVRPMPNLARVLTPPPQSNDEERSLIALAAGGDAGAARRLYDAHAERVHRLAFRLCGDADVAADLVQDSFVQVFRQLGTFRFESAFSTWLHRVVLSTSLSSLRMARRLQTAMRSARLPAVKTPHDLDFAFWPSVKRE